MTRLETQIPDLFLFALRSFGDERGRFTETYNEPRYRAHGLDAVFVQTNVSVSRQGVLRGLHAQNPSPQGKLVSVARGAVFDVVIDIRPDSPTYGKWEGFELSAANGQQLYVPAGFLHGFLTLEDDTVFLYQVTSTYDPNGDFSVAWNDDELGIEWPLDRIGGTPDLSAKDAAAPRLRDLDPARLARS